MMSENGTKVLPQKTVHECESSKLNIIECIKKLETTQKRKTFYSKYFSFNSPEDIYIAKTERPGKNRNGQ